MAGTVPKNGWLILENITKIGWFGSAPDLGNHHMEILEPPDFMETSKVTWYGYIGVKTITSWFLQVRTLTIYQDGIYEYPGSMHVYIHILQAGAPSYDSKAGALITAIISNHI